MQLLGKLTVRLSDIDSTAYSSCREVSSNNATHRQTIKALASSLKKHGLMQPLMVDMQFKLLAGWLRLAAASHLKWKEIDVAMYRCSEGDAKRFLLLEPIRTATPQPKSTKQKKGK